MTRPGEDNDEEYRPTDPAAATQDPNHDEPLDVDGSEKEYIEITTHGQSSSHSGSEEGRKYTDEKRPQIDRTKSHATDFSALTGTESHIDTLAKKKPWHKKLNPLKWGKTPPIPETRTVSREYGASFLSLVYFQWVAPIMSARHPSQHPPHHAC